MIERVAIYLQDSHDLREGLEIARYAEEKGFEAVWQAESRLVRDAIVPMAAFHLPHPRRSGARPHYLRHWRLVGSVSFQRWHFPHQAPQGYGRDHHGPQAAAEHGTRLL